MEVFQIELLDTSFRMSQHSGSGSVALLPINSFLYNNCEINPYYMSTKSSDFAVNSSLQRNMFKFKIYSIIKIKIIFSKNIDSSDQYTIYVFRMSTTNFLALNTIQKRGAVLRSDQRLRVNMNRTRMAAHSSQHARTMVNGPGPSVTSRPSSAGV